LGFVVGLLRCCCALDLYSYEAGFTTTLEPVNQQLANHPTKMTLGTAPFQLWAYASTLWNARRSTSPTYATTICTFSAANLETTGQNIKGWCRNFAGHYPVMPSPDNRTCVNTALY